MAPLPAPEPSKLLETLETMDARKIRFERNRIRLPMGVEGLSCRAGARLWS